MMKRTLFFVGVLALVLVSASALGNKLSGGNSGTKVAEAQSVWPKELTGWAWSDNIGWISFNCSNTNSCATSNYKVSMLDSVTTNHYLSGYAWSDSVGWISFNSNEVFPCPDGCNAPSISVTSGQVIGSAWAMSGNKNAPEGEWNGYIEMSAYPSHPSPMGGGDGGVTYNPATGAFTGYAFGSVLGWVNFNVSLAPVTCLTCVSNACTGTTPPAHAVNGGNSGSGAWTYLASGSLGACQWRCDVANGYQYSGGACVQNFSCVGTAPAHSNTSTVSPSNSGTNWTFDSSGNLNSACQFSCSIGYHYNSAAGTCDADTAGGSCTGFAPENATRCNPLDATAPRVLGKPGTVNGASGTGMCSTVDPLVPSCEYYCGNDLDGNPLKKRGNRCLTGLQYYSEE